MTIGTHGLPAKDPLAHALERHPLLAVLDLGVRFHTKRGTSYAVDGVNFDIAEGETLGLVGETGSGKSITARALLGLVPQPPGEIAAGRAFFHPRTTCTNCHGAGCEMCGGIGRTTTRCPSCKGTGCDNCGRTGLERVDLLGISERKMRTIRGNHISMIFQDPGKALDPGMSIRNQVAEVFAEHRYDEIMREAGMDPEETNVLLRRDARHRGRLFEKPFLALPPLRSGHRRLKAVIDERIARALAETRIPNPRKVMERYPHELSGGMKQRVMIAQALAAGPELLIADEPTTALDVTIQARILDVLAEVQERFHMAVLYISHDLSLVRRISDRVAVMYAGRVVETGPADEVFDNPLHPYTRGLIGAIPSKNQRRGSLIAVEGSVPEFVDAKPSCHFAGRCPYAMPICKSVNPPLNLHGTGSRVACFIYEDASDFGVTPADMPSRDRE